MESKKLKLTNVSSKPADGKLIVVSNRLPFVLRKNEITGTWERNPSAGGLVTAVAPVVIKRDGLWIGWAGVHLEEGEEIPESDPNDNTPTAGLRSDKVVHINFDSETFNNYYNGCCNGMFWPLFHSMPDRAQFCVKAWTSYCTVNEEFASKTVGALTNLSTEGGNSGIPIVWLHDYHLMLAANGIRNASERLNLKLKLGFFLHIPFPPWDIFRLFPWSDEILQGMLGCDMVGFHIKDYCINFVECCQRRLGCRVDRKNFLVEHGGRTVHIRFLPIGIPFDRFVEMAKQAPVVIDTSLQLVLGVDRLDYTKGLVHRLKIFETLLERYPQHKNEVALMQIAVPSRTNVKEYQDLKEEMDQLVGRINGRFSTPNWSPIKYIYGCINQKELAALYRDSAVALVTPLRDGMNLVAKEYVACQITNSPGVLVVSPFAGASVTMNAALLCNPYELVEAADVLHRALTMPMDERVVRMNLLRSREKKNDVDFWMQSFLIEMGTLIQENRNVVSPTTMQPVTLQDFDVYLSNYIGTKTRLALLLDYDGTLAPIASHPDLAILPWETKSILERLAQFPDVSIAIISGRNVHNLKDMVGINGLTYAGNHGLEIIDSDGSCYNPLPKVYEYKMIHLSNVLEYKVCKDGAWLEDKVFSLKFHYRDVPVDAQPKLVSLAQQLIKQAGFKADLAHCAIEAKPPIEWNKGRASLYILNTAYGMDWSENLCIIYAGDDLTDEDAMQALKGLATTFRVVQSRMVKTVADYRLPSTDSVLTMLKWIERHFGQRLPCENFIDGSSNGVQI